MRRLLAFFLVLALGTSLATLAHTSRRYLYPEFQLSDHGDAFNSMFVTKTAADGTPIVIQITTLGPFAGVSEYLGATGRLISDCFSDDAACPEVAVHAMGVAVAKGRYAGGRNGDSMEARAACPSLRIATFAEPSFVVPAQPPIFSSILVSHDPQLYDEAEGTFLTPRGTMYMRAYDNFVRQDMYVQHRHIKYFVKLATCEVWSDDMDAYDADYGLGVHGHAALIAEPLERAKGVVLRDRASRVPVATCVSNSTIILSALRADSMQARVPGYSFGYLDNGYFELQPRARSHLVRIIRDNRLVATLSTLNCALARAGARQPAQQALRAQRERFASLLVMRRGGVLTLGYEKAGTAVVDFLHCHEPAGRPAAAAAATVFGRRMNARLDDRLWFRFDVGGGIEVVSM